MAISNVSSNNRPGVCTFATRPTAPFNGQVIYETDTKQTLVWQGSAWVMLSDADQPPGLQLVKTQTVGTAAVPSVTVSNAFSVDYDSYRIVISNVTMSSTASGTVIYLKMHDGTNPANTNYNDGFARIDIAATTVAGVATALGTNGVTIGRGTGDKFGTSLDVVNPNFATHTLFPQLSALNVSSGYMYIGAGMHQTSTAYTGFQIAPSTGTLTGGTIRVYGYRN